MATQTANVNMHVFGILGTSFDSRALSGYVAQVSVDTKVWSLCAYVRACVCVRLSHVARIEARRQYRVLFVHVGSSIPTPQTIMHVQGTLQSHVSC